MVLKKANQHIASSSNGLNKLRAAVLGGNDGIVSVAGIILGVAGASTSQSTIFIAGFAGLVSGAISMAAGEFVSVSSQRDSEKAFLERTRNHIASIHHANESEEFVQIFQAKGLSYQTAKQVAKELKESGTLTQELEKELGIDPDDINNPWAAAIASATAFSAGALIPLLVAILVPTVVQLPSTVGAVIISLILTGTLSARAGNANKTRAALRVVIWGIGAMIITYAIGHLVGVSIGS